MKALLAFALIFSTSAALAGQLNIDVVPSQGGATYLEFVEANGLITSNGNGPLGGVNNTTHIEERADGSLQGFMFGTPINLTCTQTDCVDNGSTQINLHITTSPEMTSFDGTIQYHFVHATLTGKSMTVSSDGSFQAMKRKNDTFSGQGSFSRVRFGAFDVKLATSGGFNINDPKLFVLTVLNTFTGR